MEVVKCLISIKIFLRISRTSRRLCRLIGRLQTAFISSGSSLVMGSRWFLICSTRQVSTAIPSALLSRQSPMVRLKSTKMFALWQKRFWPMNCGSVCFSSWWNTRRRNLLSLLSTLSRITNQRERWPHLPPSLIWRTNCWMWKPGRVSLMYAAAAELIWYLPHWRKAGLPTTALKSMWQTERLRWCGPNWLMSIWKLLCAMFLLWLIVTPCQSSTKFSPIILSDWSCGTWGQVLRIWNDWQNSIPVFPKQHLLIGCSTPCFTICSIKTEKL